MKQQQQQQQQLLLPLLLLLGTLLVHVVTAQPSCNDTWFETDYQLMTSNDTSDWKLTSDSDGIALWYTKVGNPPSDWEMFRWKIPSLNASSSLVYNIFTFGILEYSKNWTPTFINGSFVAQINANTTIVYMQFSSGLSPVVYNRDLCYLCCTRNLGDGVYQASYRSVSDEFQSYCPPIPSDFIRISWWGANLFSPVTDVTSSLILIDQEIQNGWVPPFIANEEMPGYLIAEYEALETFFQHPPPPVNPSTE